MCNEVWKYLEYTYDPQITCKPGSCPRALQPRRFSQPWCPSGLWQVRDLGHFLGAAQPTGESLIPSPDTRLASFSCPRLQRKLRWLEARTLSLSGKHISASIPRATRRPFEAQHRTRCLRSPGRYHSTAGAPTRTRNPRGEGTQHALRRQRIQHLIQERLSASNACLPHRSHDNVVPSHRAEPAGLR